jgi:ubiquinone biosynthesis protein
MGMLNGAAVLPPLRRYREIAAVLIRHGLGDIASMLGIARFRALARARPNLPASRNVRIRLALEELGPTFIKFGQALSVRGDLLPPDLVAELSKLQDDVPPLPAAVAEREIETALGAPVSDLFAAFDPAPVAAASIAQVHEAVLPDGRLVAVKVRRPDIAGTIEDDLAALAHLARAAERHLRDAALYSPVALVAQFARTIRRELDLAREGRMLERFAANFAGHEEIVFPRVEWALTRPTVLTMEYIDGAKLDEPDTWPAGTNPAVVARHGADVLLQQILVDGLFHADPHPGNIFVLPGNVIALLDFGIVGRLDESMRERLADLVVALGRRDAERAATVLVTIAEAPSGVRMPDLEADIADLVDAYAGVSLREVRIGEVVGRILDLISTHRLKLPPDLMLLIKALVTIEGVGRRLDPEFRLIEHAAPFAARVGQERYSAPALAARAAHAGRGAAAALASLPHEVIGLASQLRGGQLSVNVLHRNADRVTRDLDRVSSRITSAILVAGLVVGGALIAQRVTGGLSWILPWIAAACFVVATGVGVATLVSLLWRSR